MANVTITLASICSGGGHQVLNVTGAVTRTLTTAIDIDATLTPEEQEAWVKGCVLLAKGGRTKAQLLNVLTGGLLVQVE